MLPAMRRVSWLLLLSLAFACSSDDSPPQVLDQRAAPIGLRAESDLLGAGVLGPPALLSGGRRVEARATDEPGESDLWLVEASGAAASLAAAQGPDEMPMALPDGRVAFVSGRTTVASLWIVEPSSGLVVQITNRGLVAGKPWSGFVPPPARDVRISASALSYDDGSGRRWSVDFSAGKAEAEADP